MNSFFEDIYINSRELNYLTKEIKKKQLNKTIALINKFNDMQKDIIKNNKINSAKYTYKNANKKHI